MEQNYVYIRDENGKIIGRTYSSGPSVDKRVSGGDSANLVDQTDAGSKKNSETATVALGFLFLALLSLPLWIPYVVLLFAVLTGGLLSLSGLGMLAYIALHTILIIKCRKLTGDKKYFPVYVGCGLFVLTFRLLSLPAIAFLGYWLWKMTKGDAPKDDATAQG